jgi:hypothetical protein
MEKLVASMAANDAFRDAIVLVRVYEDERSAGTVATGALGPTNIILLLLVRVAKLEPLM